MNERKTFESIGPWHIYAKLAMLAYYRPDYWRKVARFLSKLRRMNHIDFSGECFRRSEKYARAAFRDTKLPSMLKDVLRGCILVEFKIEIL